MVQGLRLHTLNAGGLSLIPAQGTISHVLQLILQVPQLKILHAEVKMIVHMPQLRPSGAKKKKSISQVLRKIYMHLGVSNVFLSCPGDSGRHGTGSAIVHGATKRLTQLSDLTTIMFFS